MLPHFEVDRTLLLEALIHNVGKTAAPVVAFDLICLIRSLSLSEQETQQIISAIEKSPDRSQSRLLETQIAVYEICGQLDLAYRSLLKAQDSSLFDWLQRNLSGANSSLSLAVRETFKDLVQMDVQLHG